MALTTRWEERATHRVLQSRRGQILERSRRIVEAAYVLLHDEGLDGLTIRAVLKKAGVSRRAFYDRFADKDDLMLAVFEKVIRAAADHYSLLVREYSDPVERLKLIVTCLVHGASTPDEVLSEQSNRRGAAMCREHLRLAESRPDDLQSALCPLITLIATQLSDGMTAGSVRRGDPRRLASLVYNLVSTTLQTEFLAQKTPNSERASRLQLAVDIWEFCRRAVAA